MKTKRLKLVFTIFILFISINAYSQEFWELLTPHKNVRSIDMDDDGVLFISASDTLTQEIGIFKSTDFGNTWSLTYNSPFSYSPLSVHCGENNLYFGFSGLFLSEDDGVTWEELEIGDGNYGSIYNISETELGNLYVCSSVLHRSTDYGQTWDSLCSYNYTVEFFYDVLEISTDTILAGTINWFTGGGIYRSIDGGDHWECVLQDHGVTAFVQASNGDIFAAGYAGFNQQNAAVMVSHDGGNSWESVMTGNYVQLQNMVITPYDEIYCGALNSGIYHSDDYGMSWEHFIADSITNTTQIHELEALNDGHLYISAHRSNESSNLQKLYRSIDTIYTTLPKVDGAVETLTAFPNPASESITIQLPENTASSTLQIIDINGRTVVQKQISSGESTVQLNVSSWNTGVYVARLISENRVMGRVKILVR